DRQAWLEQQHQNERERLERDAVHDVDRTHQHGFGSATEITGNETNIGADQNDEQCTEEANEQRDTRAVDVLTVEIAAKVIGAEPVVGAWRRKAIDEAVGAEREHRVASAHHSAEVTLALAGCVQPFGAASRL